MIFELAIAWLLLKPKKKTSSGSAKRNDATIRKVVLSKGYSPTLAKLLIQQAKVESANFTSKLYRSTNNAYGYKCAKGSKLQIACSYKAQDGGTFASYRSLNDSVLEILGWLRRREAEGKFLIKDLRDPLSYAKAIKKGNFYGNESPEVYARAMSQYT